MPEPASSDLELIHSAVARLRAGLMAIVCATLGGSGLLVATVWLLIRGGKNVGEHLSLLRHYLPGYSVSWPGAVVGLFYGALLGAVVGWSTTWVYNRVVESRHGVDRDRGPQ